MSLAAFALLASPLLAFLGVLLGHRLTRTSARELDRWRKREETMRRLRWGTDIALGQEPTRSEVGIQVLGALADAPLLDDEDSELVGAITRAVARLPGGTLDDEEGHPP
jgi:hypothetical protein